MWKNEQRDAWSYLYFTRKERRATFILTLLLLVWPVCFYFLPGWTDDTFPEITPLPIPEPPGQQPSGDVVMKATSAQAVERFFFDPNHLSKDSLRLLGIPERALRNLLKYRRAGGEIRSLQKIYGMPESLAKELEAWIRPNAVPSVTDPVAQLSQRPRFEGTIDPNRASGDTLLAVGFSPRTAHNLIRYREAGGVIRDTAFIRSLYGMTEAEFNRIWPHIEVPTERRRPALPADYRLDVNQSDTSDWKRLPGIGSYYASRIIRFRSALGGFSSIEQIGTTWGLPDSTFRQIRPYLTLSPVFHRLWINQAEPETLARHPYLSRKTATIICRYRDAHGPFRDTADLKQVRILTSTQIDQLAPYLDFSQPGVQ